MIRGVGAFHAAKGVRVQRGLERLALVLRLSYVPIGMSYVRSRLLFAACAPNRTACLCSVSVPPWVVIAGSAFSDLVRLSGVVGSLRACAFLYGDPDGERRDARDGERSRRRDRVRFCVIVLALRCFPRGVRWGCAPQTAPKSLRLSGLSSFDSRCGGVSRGEGRSGTTKT